MAPKRKPDAASLSGLSLAESKHTRFEDSSDETSPRKGGSLEHPSRSVSRQSQGQGNHTSLHPRTSVVPDTSKESYVTDLSLNLSEDALGVVSGAKGIVYSITPAGLREKSQFSDSIVTAIDFACNGSNHLFACGTDGAVLCWDVRQNRAAQR